MYTEPLSRAARRRYWPSSHFVPDVVSSIPAPPDISKLAAIIRDLNGDIIPHAEVTLKGAGTVTTEIAQEGSANGMLP